MVAGNEGRGCLVSRRQGLNVAAGSATNDQACDYIAAPSISAQKPPPFPVHESQIRATPLVSRTGKTPQSHASVHYRILCLDSPHSHVYHCHRMHDYWRETPLTNASFSIEHPSSSWWAFFEIRSFYLVKLQWNSSWNLGLVEITLPSVGTVGLSMKLELLSPLIW